MPTLRRSLLERGVRQSLTWSRNICSDETDRSLTNSQSCQRFHKATQIQGFMSNAVGMVDNRSPRGTWLDISDGCGDPEARSIKSAIAGYTLST